MPTDFTTHLETCGMGGRLVWPYDSANAVDPKDPQTEHHSAFCGSFSVTWNG